MSDLIPPLLDRYLLFFAIEPFWAVLVAVVVLVIAFVLLRMALRLFIFFLLLLVLALIASYFFLGEEETDNVIRQGAGHTVDMVEEQLKQE